MSSSGFNSFPKVRSHTTCLQRRTTLRSSPTDSMSAARLFLWLIAWQLPGLLWGLADLESPQPLVSSQQLGACLVATSNLNFKTSTSRDPRQATLRHGHDPNKRRLRFWSGRRPFWLTHCGHESFLLKRSRGLKPHALQVVWKPYSSTPLL